MRFAEESVPSLPGLLPPTGTTGVATSVTGVGTGGTFVATGFLPLSLLFPTFEPLRVGIVVPSLVTVPPSLLETATPPLFTPLAIFDDADAETTAGLRSAPATTFTAALCFLDDPRPPVLTALGLLSLPVPSSAGMTKDGAGQALGLPVGGP